MPEQTERAQTKILRPAQGQTKPLPAMDEINTLVRLTRLYEIVRSLNSIIQLDKLLDRIVASTVEMMDARGGALMLADAENMNLTFEVLLGGASAKLKGKTIPIDEYSIAGMVALSGKP